MSHAEAAQADVTAEAASQEEAITLLIEHYQLICKLKPDDEYLFPQPATARGKSIALQMGESSRRPPDMVTGQIVWFLANIVRAFLVAVKLDKAADATKTQAQTFLFNFARDMLFGLRHAPPAAILAQACVNAPLNPDEKGFSVQPGVMCSQHNILLLERNPEVWNDMTCITYAYDNTLQSKAFKLTGTIAKAPATESSELPSVEQVYDSVLKDYLSRVDGTFSVPWDFVTQGVPIGLSVIWYAFPYKEHKKTLQKISETMGLVFTEGINNGTLCYYPDICMILSQLFANCCALYQKQGQTSAPASTPEPSEEAVQERIKELRKLHRQDSVAELPVLQDEAVEECDLGIVKELDKIQLS